MKAKQDKSTKRNRADGNRVVMRGPSFSEVEEVIGEWLIDPDHGVTYNDGALHELFNRLRSLFEDPA